MTRGAVSEFYDKWVPEQVNKGVNLRHRKIFSLLKREGLRRGDRVLEIGCGIGAVTGLIARYLRDGNIVAVDISPKSISEAQRRLRQFGNIDFRVSDMTDFKPDGKFDAVLLPDVLEHIPMDQHRSLFQLIRECLRETGFVLIHIPNPHYLDWLRRSRPELLQVVDQSLHTDALLRDVYASNLYLHKLGSHCIFSSVPDYQAMVLLPNRPVESANPRSRSRLLLHRMIARLFY